MPNVYKYIIVPTNFLLLIFPIPKSTILLLISKSINLSSMNQNSHRISLHNVAKYLIKFH